MVPPCLRLFFIVGEFRRPTSLAFPLGERCRAHARRMRESFRLSLGSFAAPAASDFLDGQKVTKEPPRGGLRWALCAHIPPPPGPPFYEGPNQAALAVDAKARVVQSNACPSSFAAAYLAVNRELGTPLFECAFVAVGLKFSSGIRREGHTPGWLLLPLWGNSPSAPPLQVLKKAFLTWVGESLGAPVVNESGTVGSAKPGAAVGPHQPQFLQTQGPVAREKLRRSLRFCAPEIPLIPTGMRPS